MEHLRSSGAKVKDRFGLADGKMCFINTIAKGQVEGTWGQEGRDEVTPTAVMEEAEDGTKAWANVLARRLSRTADFTGQASRRRHRGGLRS